MSETLQVEIAIAAALWIFVGLRVLGMIILAIVDRRTEPPEFIHATTAYSSKPVLSATLTLPPHEVDK